MAGFGHKTGQQWSKTQRKSKMAGEVLFKKAIEQHIKGELKNAEQYYREAIKSGYIEHSIFSNLGVICKNSKRTDEAIYLFKKAIELSPKHPDAYSNLGNLYTDLGDLNQAMALTLKSLELKADNPKALINQSRIYKKLGNLNQALEANLKSLELQPDNPNAHMNLGSIYQDLGNLDQALAATLQSLELKPDNPNAHMNLGSIYQDLGNLDQALAATLQSLELKPDNPDALINLGAIYKDLGNLDQALTYTLQSLELKPDNPDALVNLGAIYKDLGNLDQGLINTLQSLKIKPNNPDALINLGAIHKDLGNLDQAIASILQSLKLRHDNPNALCKLGQIKIALGQTKEGKKDLSTSLEQNNQECESYYTLSTILETQEEAKELIKLIKSVKMPALTPQRRALMEFAQCNCLHKTKNYELASKHLQLANKSKLIAFSSNAKTLQKSIAASTSKVEAKDTTHINTTTGKERIFIVGMPRSGSTLLETILSMNPEIKDLGESKALANAIEKISQDKSYKYSFQSLDKLYSEIEPINVTLHKYTADKQLYNFIHINIIATYMPGAKIVHCRRNPMDNILSMYRSNLAAGNNYTASLEDSAKVLIAQEQAMKLHKMRHPGKIFTYNYDEFVNTPESSLRKLLKWLGLEFQPIYLCPEKSTRTINTASVTQARKPISNRSVGGWKNYRKLLNPAIRILQEGGIKVE